MNSLDPLENYKYSKKQYNKIKLKVLDLYGAYENKERISILLEYWFWNIRNILKVFGEQGLREFLCSNMSSPLRFAIYKTTNEYQDLNFENKSNKFIFYFIKFFGNKLYLQGANLSNLNRRIAGKICRKIVKSIPINKDFKLRKEIIKLSLNYFSDFEIEDLHKMLLKKLPVIFFGKPVPVPHKNLLINIECCASCFFEFNNYENAFLLNKKIFLKGLQHGGGYDCFKIDYSTDFEKSLCDEFFGWGLSKFNLKQHRFHKFPQLNIKTIFQKRIIWIEDSNFPDFYSMLFPSHHAQSKNLKNAEYIYDEMKRLKYEYLNLVHPVIPADKYKKYRVKLLLRNSRKGESLFLPNDVGIFDSSASTLIHFFVENNMPFIQVIDRSEFDLFTNNQKNWFSFLYDSGLGCFNDEVGRLNSSMQKIMKHDYVLNSDVISFHKKVFNT